MRGCLAPMRTGRNKSKVVCWIPIYVHLTICPYNHMVCKSIHPNVPMSRCPYVLSYICSYVHKSIRPSVPVSVPVTCPRPRSPQILLSHWIYNPPLHCCTALYCTTLHCTVLHYIPLHYTALHSTVLYCTTLHCTTLLSNISNLA